MNYSTLILILLLVSLLIFWFCYREIRNALVLPNLRPRRSHPVARELKHHIWAKHPSRRN